MAEKNIQKFGPQIKRQCCTQCKAEGHKSNSIKCPINLKNAEITGLMKERQIQFLEDQFQEKAAILAHPAENQFTKAENLVRSMPQQASRITFFSIGSSSNFPTSDATFGPSIRTVTDPE